MRDVWAETIIVLGTISIIALFYFIIVGMASENRKIESCKKLGGIPITERSTYKLCGKPENFMKIEVK